MLTRPEASTGKYVTLNIIKIGHSLFRIFSTSTLIYRYYMRFTTMSLVLLSNTAEKVVKLK